MPQSSNFDRLARPYHLIERLTFGAALQHCRTAHLSRVLSARHALVLGDGDGRFTAALLAANPHVQVIAVDTSPAMLSLLTARAHRLRAASRLTTHTADALDFLARLPAQCSPLSKTQASTSSKAQAPAPSKTQASTPSAVQASTHPSTHPAPPHPSFDLLATHFFLDCLTPAQVRSLAHNATRILAPGALWVVSDFATPNMWSHAVVSALYLAFRLLAGLRVQRLPPFRSILAEAGFTPVADRTSLQGLLASTAWTLACPPQPLSEHAPKLPQATTTAPRALPPV